MVAPTAQGLISTAEPLQAGEVQGTMMSGLLAATVYGAGGTINNNSFAITLLPSLSLPLRAKG